MKEAVRITIGFVVVFLFCLLLFRPCGDASECRVCETRADGGEICVTVDCKPQKAPEPEPPRSELEKLYDEGLRFSGGDFPDENESADVLRVYWRESKKVGQVIKKRAFSVPLDTGRLSLKEWLMGSVKTLLAAQARYPESRHLSEMLGWVYREIYYDTGDTTYLRKAADAFIRAEDLGMKHHGPVYYYGHYYKTIPELLTDLRDKSGLDAYFGKMLERFPDEGEIPRYYALALAELGDERAHKFFRKAISMRRTFGPVAEYAEYLLDRNENRKALKVLEELTPQEEYAYTYFLKGVALERLGDMEAAKREYEAFVRDNVPPGEDPKTYKGGYKVPRRYMVPGSTIQGDIPFDNILMDKRETPCRSDDWECKARHYMVWTIDGEAGGTNEGSMRAVGFNIRSRVMYSLGTIWCFGVNEVCYNNVDGLTYAKEDLASLYKRYWYVIEKGVYKGLDKGTYTERAENVFKAVIEGRVPDPIVGRCVPGSGYMTGDRCTGTCSGKNYWGGFSPGQSSQEFRMGVLKWVSSGTWPFAECWQFLPASTPKGTRCGKNCFVEKGPVCPVNGTRGGCSSWTNAEYSYEGPVSGNIFWRFNIEAQ